MADDKSPKFTVPAMPSLVDRSDFLPHFDMTEIRRQEQALAKSARERTTREKQIAAAAEHALNAAALAVDCLMDEIARFEETLGESEEVALYVIGGPAGQSFFPQMLRALNPDKVLYGGTDQAGRPFTVVQHVSQLNFAMMASVVAEDEQPRRIGFHIPGEEG